MFQFTNIARPVIFKPEISFDPIVNLLGKFLGLTGDQSSANKLNQLFKFPRLVGNTLAQGGNRDDVGAQAIV